MKSRSIAVFSICVVLGTLAVGCSGEPDKIERYQVDKQHVLLKRNHVARSATSNIGKAPTTPQGKPTDRMLAALVPHKDKVWSFKVTGPIPAVSTIADAFGEFIKTVTFSDDKPSWTLPTGWRQAPDAQAASSFIKRFATIRIDADGKPLDLKIMSIPAQPNDSQGYLLKNVNRWRGQMSLPDLRIDQLESETTAVDVQGSKATLVDLEGILAGGMGRPFAAGAAPRRTAPPRSAPPRSAPPRASASPIEYEVPREWKQGPPVVFSKASFVVTDQGKSVKITASDLAAAAGDLLANVNRWRGPIKLGLVTQAELEKQLKPFQIGGADGHYVELIGPADAQPRHTTLGMIVIHGGKAWFFKLTGDADLAQREKQRFEAFVRSIRFR